MGNLLISPLAAAILLQRPSMGELVVCKLRMSTLSERTMFQLALRAASEAVDLKWIERLVQIGGTVRPVDLNCLDHRCQRRKARCCSGAVRCWGR